MTKDIFDHLKTTKKVHERAADSDMMEQFIKTSDIDHWVHALNYALIAGMVVENLGDGVRTGSLPMVGKVRVGSAVEEWKGSSMERVEW